MRIKAKASTLLILLLLGWSAGAIRADECQQGVEGTASGRACCPSNCGACSLALRTSACTVSYLSQFCSSTGAAPCLISTPSVFISADLNQEGNGYEFGFRMNPARPAPSQVVVCKDGTTYTDPPSGDEHVVLVLFDGDLSDAENDLDGWAGIKIARASNGECSQTALAGAENLLLDEGDWVDGFAARQIVVGGPDGDLLLVLWDKSLPGIWCYSLGVTTGAGPENEHWIDPKIYNNHPTPGEPPCDDGIDNLAREVSPDRLSGSWHTQGGRLSH